MRCQVLDNREAGHRSVHPKAASRREPPSRGLCVTLYASMDAENYERSLGRKPTSLVPGIRAVLRRSGPAVLVAGLVGLVGSAAVTYWLGVPEPAYHDESSYLLAADTFLHGRLANPPHPFWQHFEAFHVLQQPTYASKYPPGQGLLLALGELLAGHPIAGSWLGGAVMTAAVCWMLAGFMPVRWALFGALLTMVQVGPTTYWVQGYWGGCLPAAGGALLFGALPRLRRRGRTRDAVALAVGLVVLANTRPFEGLLAALLAAAVLGPWFLRGEGHLGRRVASVALPIVLILAAAGAAMAFYNRAVTGDPWRMPYSVYEETASGLPLFIWQQPKPPPEFRHEIQRRFYEEYLLALYGRQRGLSGWLEHRAERLAVAWAFYFGPWLSVLWLAVPWTFQMRGVRLALSGLGLFLLASAVTSYLHSHYAAPFCALAFLAMTAAVRRVAIFVDRRWLAVWTRRHGWRRALVPALLLAALLAERSLRSDPILRVGRERGAVTAKADVERYLEAQDGADLVLVRYGPASDVHDEWVSNGAEIDEQPIVWARSMGPERDRRLAAYFVSRQVWTVTIGRSKRGEVGLDRGI